MLVFFRTIKSLKPNKTLIDKGLSIRVLFFLFNRFIIRVLMLQENKRKKAPCGAVEDTHILKILYDCVKRDILHQGIKKTNKGYLDQKL